MAQIEKTVFISYRRTDVYTALAVYENLKNQGYDVFFDYRSISSGDFEQIITSNIQARAHFLLILTPTALDRCNEPGDWLRSEIETAIDEKRNIVPLFFKGFRFGVPMSAGRSNWLRRGKSPASNTLTGKLRELIRYNGLNVHEDYFEEAMQRLRTEFLNKPLDTVLHPVSTDVQKVVRAEQVAADKALEQIEDVKELVKQAEETPAQKKELRKPIAAQSVKSEPANRVLRKTIPWRPLAGFAGGLLLIALCIWGGVNIWNNLSSATPESTRTSRPAATQTSHLARTEMPTPTEIVLDVGLTMTGKDGMTLLYVPAGEFTMGSDIGEENERPAHTVTLDAFWIDQTEVTMRMYYLCVQVDVCREPTNNGPFISSSYYGNAEFDNYPVINVDWSMAKTYCEWVERRLPTEAEWEKAARGPDARTYPWGNTYNGTFANACDKNCPFAPDDTFDDGFAESAPVGNYPLGKSVYGVLDMAGNVEEWVADWYSAGYYFGSPASNPLGPDSGQARVTRGGSWLVDSYFILPSRRTGDDPSRAKDTVGFRCAVSASAGTESIPTVLPTYSATPSLTSLLGIGSTMTGEDGMILLYVPAGEFTMGSDSQLGGDNAKPVHTVYLDAFWIDKTEVTNKMYALCVNASVCKIPTSASSITRSSYYGNSQFDNYPVIYVDWNMAKTYCEWADRRLPTEAEWEKAARGTDGRIYPWGNNAPNNNLLNYNSVVGDTTQVGKYPSGASPYGALDMAGNVWEWVADWYDSSYYGKSPTFDPPGPISGTDRVLRGGSWDRFLNILRSTDRSMENPSVIPDFLAYSIGFRCSRSP